MDNRDGSVGFGIASAIDYFGVGRREALTGVDSGSQLNEAPGQCGAGGRYRC